MECQYFNYSSDGVYTINDLHRDTAFNVVIAGFTKVGVGAYSQPPVRVETKPYCKIHLFFVIFSSFIGM